MLGHQLWRHFHREHETWVTLRKPVETFSPWKLFKPAFVRTGVDATDFTQLGRLLCEVRPDAVLNCVGIIKQLKEAKSPIPSITINSLLPHRVAEICGDIGARLVHFSTDCVFSGRKGGYLESDRPDAEDLYGRTKLLGEVSEYSHAVTLRSSIIGWELGTQHSLLEWFLAQEGKKIRGFRRAIFSGLTTVEMARVVEGVLERSEPLHGLWQVASAPISKFDLLTLVRDRFKVQVEIEPHDDFHCDRSLCADRFNAAMNYVPPSWDRMIGELAQCDAKS